MPPCDVTTTTTVVEVPPTPAFAADVLPRTGGSSVLLVVKKCWSQRSRTLLLAVEQR